MKKSKSYLKSIRGFFRSFDFFGEYLAFRYKDEDKQSSVLSGIVCIAFYIIAIVYFIYNLIPFINNDIFSLQYYTVGLDKTEPLNMKEDPMMFALGLTIEDNLNPYVFNYLNLKVYFKKNRNDNTEIAIPTRNCIAEDFPYEL